MKKIGLLMAFLLLFCCLGEGLGEESVKTGDHVYYGQYEFDGNTENGLEPLEWRVLSVEGEKALLITAYIIDGRAIDGVRYMKNAYPWPKSPIRQWLNGEFMDIAFTAEEKASILTVTNKTEKNPDYNSGKVADSKDQVFYLSLAEAEKYFADDNDRMVRVTPYGASLCLAPAGIVPMYHSFMPLRNYGARQDIYASTKTDGMIMSFGMMYAWVKDHPVRPAMWVKTAALTPLPPEITILSLGHELHWTKVSSAAAYRYEITGADGKILASGQDIPQDFAKAYLYSGANGETISITVTALAQDGREICRKCVQAVWNDTVSTWDFSE